MQKVLVGILGRGQFNKESGKYDYKETEYRLENGTKKSSKLVLDILKDEIKPDQVYIVGTKESLWGVADEYIGKYKKIIVPYGKNSEEFWEIFEVFLSLDMKDKEIHFDITHGFRSIPLFVSTLLNFFTKVKGARIGGVYYGIFEAKNDDGSTPVVNMLPFLEMNRFIEAFYIFKKYADGTEIASIIEEKLKDIPVEQKKEFSKLKSLAKELRFYSKSVGFSALRFYQSSLEKIEGIITEVEKVPSSLKATGFLMDDMEKEAGRFKGIKTLWRKDLLTAQLFFERKRYAQSLTILRETALTYILEILGLDVDDENLREKALSEAIKVDEENVKQKKQQQFFTKDWIILYKEIRNLRNRANHAFVKKGVGEKVIKKSVENLEKFLSQAASLMQEDRVIADKEKLYKFLKEDR